MINLSTLAIQPNVYYTADEAAQLLRVSRQMMRRLLQSERVQGVKIGREWRILGAALLDLSGGAAETEADIVADWLAASNRSLVEVWDNPQDDVYDEL